MSRFETPCVEVRRRKKRDPRTITPVFFFGPPAEVQILGFLRRELNAYVFYFLTSVSPRLLYLLSFQDVVVLDKILEHYFARGLAGVSTSLAGR